MVVNFDGENLNFHRVKIYPQKLLDILLYQCWRNYTLYNGTFQTLQEKPVKPHGPLFSLFHHQILVANEGPKLGGMELM